MTKGHAYAVGDLTQDGNKGLTKIEYDYLGHPVRIQFRDGSSTEYVYAADGRKLKEKHTTAVEGIAVNMGITLSPEQIMDADSIYYADGFRWDKHPFDTFYDAYDLDDYFDEGFMSLRASYGATPTGQPPVYSIDLHYFVRGYQGHNRMVVSSSGTIEQRNEYYPYGGPWGTHFANQGFQPLKYTGKELDRVHGLDWYDYGARRYNPAIGLFTQEDPLAEQYPYLNPYLYCAGNPMRYVDPDGDSICILNMGDGLRQHMALLIQNEENKWAYYSFNGDKIYNRTKGKLGGGPFNNLGVRTFYSPQEFLDSNYNSEEEPPKAKMAKDQINGYGYREGYVICTTREQDATITSTYKSQVEEGYHLLFNQCSQVVQKSLNAAGIKTSRPTVFFVDPQSMHYIVIEVNPYFPSSAFKSIIYNNPRGKLYKRK